MNAQTQLQQGAPAFPPPQGPAASSSQAPNLASILSQFQIPVVTGQTQTQPPQQQQQQQPPSQPLAYNQNQSKQHGSFYEDADRKRMREGHGHKKHGGYDNNDEVSHGHGHGHGHGNKRARTNGEFKHKKHVSCLPRFLRNLLDSP